MVIYATEAALELKKNFHSTQNYVKMIDRTIDEMEKDDEYKNPEYLQKWYGSDDPKSNFEYEGTKNKKLLQDYTVPMLQQYAKPIDGMEPPLPEPQEQR